MTNSPDSLNELIPPDRMVRTGDPVTGIPSYDALLREYRTAYNMLNDLMGDASTRKDEGTVSDSRTNTSPDLPREIWVLDELRQKLTGLVDVGAGREICTFTIEAILMLVTPYLRTTEPVSVSFDDIMNACKHITGTDIGIEFNHKHDARYCPNCNIWLENNCGDKKCELCKDRPERPL